MRKSRDVNVPEKTAPQSQPTPGREGLPHGAIIQGLLPYFSVSAVAPESGMDSSLLDGFLIPDLGEAANFLSQLALSCSFLEKVGRDDKRKGRRRMCVCVCCKRAWPPNATFLGSPCDAGGPECKAPTILGSLTWLLFGPSREGPT